MYQIPKHTPKIRLIHRDGHYWEYKNLTEAADELFRIFRYDINGHIGETFNSIRKEPYWFHNGDPKFFTYHYDYIVRTEFGDIITVSDLADARTKPASWYDKWRPARNNYEFRKGPVPYTRKRRGGHKGYRRPKSFNERKAAEAHKLDEDIKFYGVKIRAKRNFNNLIDSWDDYPRRDWGAKNWKVYRKTQWKEKVNHHKNNK